MPMFEFTAGVWVVQVLQVLQVVQVVKVVKVEGVVGRGCGEGGGASERGDARVVRVVSGQPCPARQRGGAERSQWSSHPVPDWSCVCPACSTPPCWPTPPSSSPTL